MINSQYFLTKQMGRDFWPTLYTILQFDSQHLKKVIYASLRVLDVEQLEIGEDIGAFFYSDLPGAVYFLRVVARVAGTGQGAGVTGEIDGGALARFQGCGRA